MVIRVVEFSKLRIDFESQILVLFDTSPLTQFSKSNNFLSNFIPPIWKLYNPYCHTARLSKTNSLVIHVVGARQAETLDLTRWEIFCYQLPKLLNLIVVFIGPELVWVKTYFSIIYFWLQSIWVVIGSANLLCNNFFFEALNFQDSQWYSSKYFFLHQSFS